MPGSPVDAKTHSRSAPSSSSTMPPLPSVSSSGPRLASFSTTACKRDVSSSNLSIHSVDFVACVFFSHVVSYKRLGSTGPLYHLNPSLPPPLFLSPLLSSDQWESPFPANPECSAVSTAAVQQRTVLFLFLLAGQPAAAGHVRRSPAEQAEAVPDHAAAVWQRHLS